MNAFNRAFMVLLALALASGGLLVFLLVSGLMSDTFMTSPEFIRLAQDIHAYSEGTAPAWLAGSLGALVAGVGLFFAELPLKKPRAKHLSLRNDGAGAVTVSLNGLRRLTEHVIRTLPGVEQVQADARADQKGLSLECHLQVAPDTSAPTLAAEARELVSNTMEQHIGRPPIRVDIHTQVGQPTGIRRRVR
jgi:hypothetical protein